MNRNGFAYALIGLLLAALVWVLFFWSPADDAPVKHQNLQLTAAPVGGDFTVETQDGDLSLKDLRGKVVALYFGYTQCPDICPTSLALLTHIFCGFTIYPNNLIIGLKTGFVGWCSGKRRYNG